MLTETELRNALLGRLKAVNGQSNVVLLAHTDGFVRAILLALTGVDHGTYLTGDCRRVLNLAGIPFTEKDGLLHFED